MTIAKTMNAVVLTGHGGLDKLDYRQDWPTPVAEAGEVRVKVGACGLNNTDILAIQASRNNFPEPR